MTPTFSAPKRRATRQRSGQTVSGERTGSEAKIVRCCAYQVLSPGLSLFFERADVGLVPQFERGVGMGAIGGYVKCEAAFDLGLSLVIVDSLASDVIAEGASTGTVPGGSWHRFGLHLEVEDPQLYDRVELWGEVRLERQEASALGALQFHAVRLDSVTEYDSQSVGEAFGPRAEDNFRTKTHLYCPEIYYWDEEDAFSPEPSVSKGDVASVRADGEQIVLKACNRCARFLPVDVVSERTALGYSNHCVKRAPCEHTAFSRLSIENWGAVGETEGILAAKVGLEGDSHVVRSRYGFQLECRPCKKFKVNAPLNPLRNAAQRREDSLRRRAVERLARELLGIDWVFYRFRREGRPEEFDGHIWERFGRRCFGCGKALPHVEDMDLDHTLPLAYLWPLDETATCLCSTCNSQKHDKFPYEFERYIEPGKLERLSELTGIPSDLILAETKAANPEAVLKLRERVEWFFDSFLNEPEYQRVRRGKRAADLIVASIQRILDECGAGLDLVQEYLGRTGRLPDSVSVNGVQGRVWGVLARDS